MHWRRDNIKVRLLTIASTALDDYFYTMQTKTIGIISILFFLSTLLCSCPYSSPYQLDDTPNIYIEDALLGNWAVFVTKPVTGKQEPVKMILSKKNDTEYNIVFTGKINELKPFNVIKSDSISGTAFMSTVVGKQLLNISIKGATYIVELRFTDNKLSLLPLVEHFTAKMVQSNAALRTCLEFHYKTRVHALYDEDFCLKEMVKVN